MKHVEELRSFYTEMWGGNNNLIGLKTKRWAFISGMTEEVSATGEKLERWLLRHSILKLHLVHLKNNWKTLNSCWGEE